MPEQRWIGKEGRKEGREDEEEGIGRELSGKYTVEGGGEFSATLGYFLVASPVKSVSLSSKRCVCQCVVV